MIDTANMGIMANLIQQSSSSISTQMISKKDTDEDSSLSIEEIGVSDNIFASYDSDSSGLINQSELTTAIDSAMSEFSEGMPSKEDFQSMLSSFGFEAPTATENNTSSSSNEETISSVLAEYDADNLTQSDAQAIVAAFQDAGIEPSEELASAMEEAGFDAREVGTLAGVEQGGTPPSPPNGGDTISQTDEYDSLDTNEDGIVSFDELQEAFGNSNNETTSLTQNQQNALDNLGILMDMLKAGTDGQESSVDTKDFDGLLKAINNQNNNSNINLYLQNTNTSSLSGYA
ncbi:hypothetical protein KO488_12485 [Poseidonibacter lekithochrous]|uniref:hypothetical protein n=1 Tax=Poseidonibacter TaxID=2321187 RepID=UPI001C092509|nr:MULTISPECIES: hypothetical protein [Poseidonibacter]MBU3015578.1 hypothetical protein [Poseidonibacter lekithochrous]MDO6828877.1 hypothetical protein [Poseidonibacter sp. 1_MG-2023]